MRLSLPLLLAALLAAGSAHAAACDLLGGDADGDGICDDGNGSGVAGDTRCSCQPGSPASCTTGCDDDCPFTANPSQLDVGGLSAPGLPDGIGDACQCLDVSNDGRANVLDATLYRRALASLSPPLPAPQKCLGAGASACDAGDVALLRSALAGAAAPPANVCAAAGDCTSSANCPPGISCNLGTQRCQDNLGQSCVQNGQCLSGACCERQCADLQTDFDDCGACGHVCTNPHGSQACAAGSCAPVCDANWRSCDGNPNNGCEAETDTLANCGGCQILCSRANASATCPGGVCTLASCNPGFANCDGNGSNGCEIGLGQCGPGTCGVILGSFQGDGNGCALDATQSHLSSASYVVTFREDSGINCAQTGALIQLTVPSGVDYDLNAVVPARVACQHWNGITYVAGCSGANGPGLVERIRLVNPESCVLGIGDGVDQTFTATLQVQFFSGSSCSPWQLQISGGNGC